MRNKVAKRLRKLATSSGSPVEDNYEAIRTNNQFGLPTIVLAECKKALYKELKESFKKENGCNK